MFERARASVRFATPSFWNGRHVEVVDELVAADSLNHAAPPSRQRGRQGLKDIVRMFEGAFPDFRYEVEDVICEGEKVAVRDLFVGTRRGDFMGTPATGNRHDGGDPHLPFRGWRGTSRG